MLTPDEARAETQRAARELLDIRERHREAWDRIMKLSDEDIETLRELARGDFGD